jgi:hypothetical protein
MEMHGQIHCPHGTREPENTEEGSPKRPRKLVALRCRALAFPFSSASCSPCHTLAGLGPVNHTGSQSQGGSQEGPSKGRYSDTYKEICYSTEKEADASLPGDSIHKRHELDVLML